MICDRQNPCFVLSCYFQIAFDLVLIIARLQNKNKAWKLIKDSGCAGMNVGDAWISEKHCNFFVNRGKATSKDLENLINQVKEKVLKITGVSLELELQIIGNDK